MTLRNRALVPPLTRAVLAAAGLACGAGAVLAQPAAPPSIYSCTDAQGRRLTADRPIMACLDREQRELGASGTVRRVIPPALTANEREQREATERQVQQRRQRELDVLRRDQALIARYPDRAAHDASRREALVQTQGVVDAAERRIGELKAERAALNEEMEFYRKDPSKVPHKVRRAIEENGQAVEAQRRAIAGQLQERERINAMFDEELRRLQPMWDASRQRSSSAEGSDGPASKPSRRP